MDKQFFWGAATSSHQVEGGNRNDWTEWEKKNAARLAKEALNGAPGFGHKNGWPDYILNPPAGGPNPLQAENYISGRACDHYNRFREDFDIAKSLGHNAHRFSIEWSRVEPEEGKFDEKEIEHYAQMIGALRERGIEPFVTLWHFTLPNWLAEKGGARNRRFPDYFERFSATIADRIGDQISFWITINEPEIYCGNSYFRGKWPPEKKNIFSFYACMANCIRAHHGAYAAIKKKNPAAQVGFAVNITDLERGGVVNSIIGAIGDRIWNFRFLRRTRHATDFIGMNHYVHHKLHDDSGEQISDFGWRIHPESIYRLLCSLKKYNLPIYVTENGVADSLDAYRGKFISDYTSLMKKAMAEGVDVRGYFYWSLLDNFEWDKGFWPRFGLVEINYKTLERRIRPSAWEYKKIISSSAL